MSSGYSHSNPRSAREGDYLPGSLGDLRSMLGLKQTEMASMCGISIHTYRKLERNSNQYEKVDEIMNNFQAELISIATGVSPESLQEGELWDSNGDEYTEESWEDYRDSIQSDSEEIKKTLSDIILMRFYKFCSEAKNWETPASISWYVTLAIALDGVYENHNLQQPNDESGASSTVQAIRKALTDSAAKEIANRRVKAESIPRKKVSPQSRR